MAAAVVGGAAHVGAKGAQKGQAAAQQEADQNAQIAELQAQQPVAAAPPPAAADDNDPMVKVQKLAELRAAGALTDGAFSAAKVKALGI
jgi:hypothetical protein